MLDSLSLLTFTLAALVVLVIPGPGVLYVVTRSLTQGLSAGIASVLGLALGALVQVFAAAAGLSAVLLTSATAFGIIKFLGALYLIYLGLRTLLSRQSASEINAPAPDSLYRIFTDGAIVSILNPKIAVFFLAFLPQFISSQRDSIAEQFLLLGFLYVALAICTDGAYAIFANGIRRLISTRRVMGSISRYASGFVYLGLGAGLAISDRQN